MSRLILERLASGLSADRPALLCGDRRLTYAELESWSSALADKLGGAAAADEEPVGILAPASLEFAASLCAIWKAGKIAVPLQPAHPAAELRYILEDTGMKRLFVHASLQPLADELTKGSGARSIAIERASGSQTPRFEGNPGALIIYTSGTTHRPKGVVSTRASLDAQMTTLLKAWGWSETDRALDVLPLHHVHGLVVILCTALAAGASCELMEKFDADAVCARIEARAIDVFMAVPTVYTKLIQHWKKMSDERRRDFSRRAGELRLMVSGSAALPKPVFDEWAAITGQRLLERYGMTEIGMAISNPYDGPRKPGTVGRPLEGVDVRLSSEGEIHVRGPSVFREYWGKPEATRESFTSDGWFMTGDVAEQDGDGYYRILGRSSQDIIKSGGYKISALEIESAVLEHAWVAEAAVIGMPDAEWGERICCAYVPAAGQVVTEAELETFLKERLARYKIPSRWRAFETLPRNAMGKVVKRDLRKRFEES